MTVAQLAERFGVAPMRVDRLLGQMGLRDASRAHSRGEGPGREYSPAIAGLVAREIKSRGGGGR